MEGGRRGVEGGEGLREGGVGGREEKGEEREGRRKVGGRSLAIMIINSNSSQPAISSPSRGHLAASTCRGTIPLLPSARQSNTSL